MRKYLFGVLLFLFSLIQGQKIALQDSIKINIPDSYTFIQADIFNSLYFVSEKENSLLKYLPSTHTFYILKNFTSYKRLFIINPLFLVGLNTMNKTLEFYDDKLNITQDKVFILQNQIINPDLIFVLDNSRLIYFDEFSTGSFIQYNYRIHENLIFSNFISNELPLNYLTEEIYVTKQYRYLILRKNSPEAAHSYRIIRQDLSGNVKEFDFQSVKYFWDEKHFFWINENNLYLYNFENEPIKIFLPQAGEDYYVFNGQLFLWKPKVMYLYKIELEN